MAGTTAHDLNQPLMALLGNIELLEMVKDDPEKLDQRIAGIKESGQRISDIMKKIMSIRYDEIKPQDIETSIINLDQKIKILSVEDSDDDFKVINTLLSKNDHIGLNRTRSIEEAMLLLEKGVFDLIFLDYMLPDGTGLDFLKMMGKKDCKIPVVIITGHGDETIASQIIQAGACDYLPKDMVSEQALYRIITNTLEKTRLKKEVHEAVKQIAEMSVKDSLTGLYNRRYFEEALEREVSRARRYETNLTLCMMDLDHFKQINDTHGHPAGDLVLSEFGRMLREWIRQSDQVCRYGGEEFSVLFPNSDSQKVGGVCERFRKMLARHIFTYDSKQFQVTVSIGIASISDFSSISPEKLVYVADKALYTAKEKGRNRVINADT